jgi:hypothetical protein
MDDYFVSLRGKGEQTITAASVARKEMAWLVFLNDEQNEVARFNIGDVEGYGLLSSRKGPSIA